MYLMALDLSLANTGVAIFNLNTLACEYVGSIKPPSNKTTGEKLYFIAKRLIELQNEYKLRVVVLERGFHRFYNATATLYRVHGVANMVLRKYKQVYYPPKTIKAEIVKGNASKIQVRKAIEKKFPDVKFANEDESDAFAIGLCYLIKNNKIQWEKPTSGSAKNGKKSKTDKCK